MCVRIYKNVKKYMKDRNKSKIRKIIWKAGQVLDKVLFINYQVVDKSP